MKQIYAKDFYGDGNRSPDRIFSEVSDIVAC